ncbi:response regulator transcription factor [Metabacillus endolithicus]|uniref:Response regulator transcription factor n=1 Tax=Metabacillus endolithicus TaxID=1535204 RepID=A0ABW5BYD5_9BACI|nr:response regulator transcription factor [Metabacillus endolithicus]UPG63967.1 response regulator transcription factor [Metabacillus endolithicus]
MSRTILIVDDQPEITELLSLYLKKEGFHIIEAHDGMDAFQLIAKEQIDLMLVDIMMPIIDGYQLIKKVRETIQIPIIIISAKQEDQDKIEGLSLGADDFIQKPFNPLEVVARVQALLRRSYNYSLEAKTQLEDHELRKKVVGNLTLDENSFSIIKQEMVIQLTKIEYRILEMLMDYPGRVFTKQQIFERAWNDYYIGGEEDNTINVHISKLREKIEENPKKPTYIKTVRGLGYKFEKMTL